MKFVFALCAALVLVVPFSPAAAQSVNVQIKTVLADVKPFVSWYTTLNPDCSPMGATIVKVRKAPRHGKVEIEEENGFPHYAPENVRSACNKIQVPMTKVFYTAEADYVGKDSMDLEVSGANVVLKKVGAVMTEDLLSADAVVVGSPVYFGNMSGEVKTFFDNWLLKFGVFRDFKMRNKIGAAFTTGGAISNGKELTMLAIHQAMLVNQMLIVSGGGAFGASATTGPDSPGVDDKELATASALGKRVAEFAASRKS